MGRKAQKNDSLPGSLDMLILRTLSRRDLHGSVPLLFDTTTARATGKILYHTNNFIFRNQYEISKDPGNQNSVTNFFEEQDPALDRMAQDFAARLAAAVIENY
jgi:hypothetical protein